MFKRISVLVLVAIACAFCLKLGERFEIAGRAQRHLHRRGGRRAPANADECGRGCTKDSAALRRRRLLLGRAQAIYFSREPAVK